VGEPRDLQLPRPSRWPAWALATSIALHGAVLAALVLLFAPLQEREAGPVLPGLTRPVGTVPRRFVALPPTGMAALPPPGFTTPSPPDAAVRSPDSAAAEAAQPPDASTDSVFAWQTSNAGRRVAWPSFGSGLLWDRRPVPPLMRSRTHVELTDSAVKAIIQHHLDSLAALPGGGQVLPSAWNATIGGQEYGLDGKFITVAGLRIPALVLGFIPLPVAGNESEALDKAGWMRAQDYELAMPRDAIAADQKAEAKAIRRRMAAEHELRRTQMEETPPP